MIVNVVPWFHAMGTIAYLNNPIFSGMTIYVLPRFDPGEYLKIVKKYPIDGMGGAPPFIPPWSIILISANTPLTSKRSNSPAAGRPPSD